MPHAQLLALSDRVRQSAPNDVNGLRRVLDELRSVRRQGATAGLSRDQEDRIDAALLLLEYMAAMEGAVSPEALGVLARLIAATAEAPTAAEEPTQERAEEVREIPESLEVSHNVLLGQILVETGVTTVDRIGEALRRQLSVRRPLGQILVQMGAVTEGQVLAALRLQQELLGGNGRGSSHPAASTPELRLGGPARGFAQGLVEHLVGEILVRLRAVSPADLERALALQRASGKLLGETLVEMGAASWDQIWTALELQRRYR